MGKYRFLLTGFICIFLFLLFQTDKYSSEIRENLSRTGREVEAFCLAEKKFNLKSLLLGDYLSVEDNLSFYFFRN